MHLHLCAALAVVALGVWIGLLWWEWIAVVLAIALVMACEAINTSLEIVCDLITKEFHPQIRDAKDIAAAAVLLAAIGAAIVGAIVFIPHLLY
jgi:diacylglycerol kinase